MTSGHLCIRSELLLFTHPRGLHLRLNSHTATYGGLVRSKGSKSRWLTGSPRRLVYPSRHCSTASCSRKCWVHPLYNKHLLGMYKRIVSKSGCCGRTRIARWLQKIQAGGKLPSRKTLEIVWQHASTVPSPENLLFIHIPWMDSVSRYFNANPGLITTVSYAFQKLSQSLTYLYAHM